MFYLLFYIEQNYKDSIFLYISLTKNIFKSPIQKLVCLAHALTVSFSLRTCEIAIFVFH